MAVCAACHRPVAMARASCLYCGAALPRASVTAAAEATSRVRDSSALAAGMAPPQAEERDRQLLVVNVEGQTATVLAGAFGLAPFEAEMRRRRGGLQLHRRGTLPELRDEKARLEAAGFRVFLVAEADARRRAIPVTGGRPEGDVLRFRTEAGSLDLAPQDLLLIVRGPIRREYQAREVERKKPHVATLQEGYRFHLHRRVDPQPLEVDPADFAFGTQGPLTGSSLLELRAWLEAIGQAVSVDDGFKLLPPALAEATAEGGALGALRATRGSGMTPGREAAPILDNLAQFRFYSGWRAAIERQSLR